jgi:hypothetical protein
MPSVASASLASCLLTQFENHLHVVDADSGE